MKSSKNGRKYTLAFAGLCLAFVALFGIVFFHSAIKEAKDIIELSGKFLMFAGSCITSYILGNTAAKFSKK